MYTVFALLIRPIINNCNIALSRCAVLLSKSNVLLMRLCALWATDSIKGNEYRDRRKQEYQEPRKTSWPLSPAAQVTFSHSRYRWHSQVRICRSYWTVGTSHESTSNRLTCICYVHLMWQVQVKAFWNISVCLRVIH